MSLKIRFQSAKVTTLVLAKIGHPARNEPLQTSKKNEVSVFRSSAAEYLTFVATSGQGGVEAVYADESIWLTQKMMGALYDVETNTIVVGTGNPAPWNTWKRTAPGDKDQHQNDHNHAFHGRPRAPERVAE